VDSVAHDAGGADREKISYQTVAENSPNSGNSDDCCGVAAFVCTEYTWMKNWRIKEVLTYGDSI
jgi:hypothetical protein